MVNTTTAGTQQESAVAADANGNFVIVWDDGLNLIARRFTAEGVALTPEFQVSTVSTSTIDFPSIAMADDGRFAVTWKASDGSTDEIYLRVFAAEGTPLTAATLVNATSANEQNKPDVSMDDVGNFVVVWQSFGQDGSDFGIYARRYDAAGAAQGGEVAVNTITAGTQDIPAVTMTPTGDFIATWSDASSGSYEIATQRFSQTTTEAGGTATFEFALATAPTADVTVTLSNGDATEGSLSATMLTFTTADWNVPQTVTVTGLNDALVDGDVPYAITAVASSPDPAYNGVDVPDLRITNLDGDPSLDLDADDSAAAGVDFVAAWTEGAGPVAIADADATLIDPDSANLASLTVTITNLLDGAAEILSADTTGTSIVASYDSGTGVLTLSGSDTVANYQQVLRTVTYDSSADDPTTTARAIDFVASDGVNSTSVATTTLSVVPTNDAPVVDDALVTTLPDLKENEVASAGQTVAALLASGGDLITDPDSGAVEGVAVVAVDDTNGVWEFSTDGGAAWTPFGAVSNTSAVVLTDTPDDRVRFVPTVGFNGAAFLSFRAWDRTDGEVNGTTGVDVSANGGETAYSAAIESATVVVQPTEIRLLFSTSGDTGSSNAPGRPSWNSGDVMSIGDPNLVFEPLGSDGTIDVFAQIESFAADSETTITAVHFVNAAITIGSTSTVDLEAGDLLFATNAAETMTSSNSLSFATGDVVAFRPDVAGDYTSGTFLHVLDQPGTGETTGIALVEENTTVGDVVLSRGSFLFTQAGGSANDIYHFSADEAGAGTTSGTVSVLIDGPDVGVESNQFSGIMLTNEDLFLNGATVPAGSLVTTLTNTDPNVGTNGLSVTGDDVFYLSVATTTMGTGTSSATATLLFEGAGHRG